MDDGEPRYVEAKTAILGIPYNIKESFPMCPLLGETKKSEILAGYFGESSLIDTTFRVKISDAENI